MNFSKYILINICIFIKIFLVHTASYNSNSRVNLTKTEEDIERETAYILPGIDDIVHGRGTLYKVKGFVNITYEDISKKTSCNSIKRLRKRRTCNRSSYYHDSIMSSCPYYYRRNIDSNRIPSVITEAKCACQRCLKPCLISKDCRVRRSKCKETYIYIDVLRKHNHKGDYIRIVEPVSVGCSCVHRPPSRNARLCRHMPADK